MVSTPADKVRARARLFLEEGQLDQALDTYALLTELNSEDIHSLLKIAEIQSRLGDSQEAADTFGRVAAHYCSQDAYLKGLAVYKQLLVLCPERLDIHSIVAKLYEKLGLVAEATTHRRHLVTVYENQGRIDACVQILEDLLACDQAHVAARIKLAEFYVQLNQRKPAREHFWAAAKIFKQSGQEGDYMKVAERMGHLFPHDSTLFRDLAQRYLSQGQLRRALSKLQACFRIDPEDTATLNMLAECFERLGHLNKSVSIYRELMRLYRNMGEQEGLVAAAKKILVAAPDDPEALLVFNPQPRDPALQPQPAVPVFTSIPSPASPVVTSAPIQKPLGAGGGGPVLNKERRDSLLSKKIYRLLDDSDIYLKYGLTLKALQKLERVLELEPEHVGALFRRKTIYLQQNDIAAAVEVLLDIARISRAGNDEKNLAASVRELRMLALKHAYVESLVTEVFPEGLPSPAGGEGEVSTDSVLVEDMNRESVGPGLSRQPHLDLPGVGLPQSERAKRASRSTTMPLALLTKSEHLEPPDEPFTPTDTPVFTDPEPPKTPSTERGAILASSVKPVASPTIAPDESDDGLDAFDIDEEESEDVTLSVLDGGATDSVEESSEGTEELREQIIEIEFFISQGLFGDAREILAPLLDAHPGHDELMLLEKRLRDESGEDEESFLDFMDLVRSVANESEPKEEEPGQIPFEDVFEEFKKNLALQLKDTDYSTHYDLGIAYREMGLWADARREFALAQVSDEFTVSALTMQGQCFVEEKKPNEALAVYREALKSEHLTKTASLALMFDVAELYEHTGKRVQAHKYYRAVGKVEPGFRDVKKRLARLEGEVEDSEKSAGPAPTGKQKISYL